MENNQVKNNKNVILQIRSKSIAIAIFVPLKKEPYLKQFWWEQNFLGKIKKYVYLENNKSNVANSFQVFKCSNQIKN